MFPLKLEEFTVSPSSAEPAAPRRDVLEESRLEGFAAGYQAGWEEADAAREQAESARREAVTASLEALHLTYSQARADVLGALSPLVEELVGRCLPEVGRAALPGLVAEALAPWAEAAVSPALSLRCNPDDAGALADLCRDFSALEITTEEAIPSGQVWLNASGTELRVDINAALTEVSRSIQDFFILIKEEHAHG